MGKRPAIFLDRDGTLNVEKHYLHQPKDWEWIPGAVEALARLKAAGYLLIVISNQAGIARGYYKSQDVDQLHGWVNQVLAKARAAIDAFYYCPHHPDLSGPCFCRKPSPGMIFRAADEWNIDLAKSWMIGDKLLDIQAGFAAGCQNILVLTGYGAEVDRKGLPRSVVVEKSLGEASLSIVAGNGAKE